MGGKNHISNQVGASKVEYVLLVVLISVISVSALSFFGTEVKWRMAGGGTHGSIDPYFSGSPCFETPHCRRSGSNGPQYDERGTGSDVGVTSETSQTAINPTGGLNGGETSGFDLNKRPSKIFPFRSPIGEPSGN
ncbi:MAG: hypothetical protein KDD64_00345 [Bdellovibrionales bacterium]|nr:hypothetical protein [Bdellovibrionales bacterium]